MRIGRGVAFVKPNGNFAIGSVKELKDGSLIAVEPDGTETELPKGTAHRVNNETLEAKIREATGVPLDLPHYPSYEPTSNEDDEDEDDDLDDEPEDDGEGEGDD